MLHEFATIEPGLTADEPLDRLGSSVVLPPQLEPQRTGIIQGLPPIVTPRHDSAETIAGRLLVGQEEDDMSESNPGPFHTVRIPAPAGSPGTDVTLVLLHGTGGDEQQLVPLGQALLPGAELLGIRGRVLEGGRARRFFRRHAEGVLDQDDLREQAADLATLLGEIKAATSRRLVAVGFSNGANMAASVMLRHAEVFDAAILLSPMLPFEPERPPELAGRAVFIGAGRFDPMVPFPQVERLAELLRSYGAEVTVHDEPGGHQISQEEVQAAAGWLRAWAG